jgi:hypothetical protein
MSTECPLKCSEKYSRVPSVTKERFDVPSFVICSDEITLGGGSGDRRNKSPANTATTANPGTTHFAMLVFGFGAKVVGAFKNNARILSFESGAALTDEDAGTPCPDSTSRRSLCKSPRISVAV